MTPRCRERGRNEQRDDKQLLGELVTWPRLAVRLETIGQAPLALFAERQDQKLGEREVVVIAISRDADDDFIVRNVAAPPAVELIPTARDVAPGVVRPG